MTTIRQLVYSSEEATPFDRLRLDSLLNHARKANDHNGITGVLLRSPGRFVQCLEGARETVDVLFSKIRADRRHREVCVLQQLDLPLRFFQEWSMGCTEIQQSELLRLQTAQWEARAADSDSDKWQSPGSVLMKAIWTARNNRAL